MICENANLTLIFRLALRVCQPARHPNLANIGAGSVVDDLLYSLLRRIGRSEMHIAPRHVGVDHDRIELITWLEYSDRQVQCDAARCGREPKRGERIAPGRLAPAQLPPLRRVDTGFEGARGDYRLPGVVQDGGARPARDV